MPVTAEMIKELRLKTSAGIMDCKQALTTADGDMKKAEELLRAKGFAQAEKRASRVASQGLVECYIHAGGRLGALVEVNCESDFVARTDEFKKLAHDIAMQVAAIGADYVTAEEVPAGTQVNPVEACLLAQPFIRDPSKTIKDLITETIAKTGENIKVKRFARFEVGVTASKC